MKKYLMIIIAMLFMMNLQSIYGISENFKFFINTVGIPEYNVLGKQISEDVYNRYKVFSYDQPYNLIHLSKQHYKKVPLGFYNYKGQAGEFNLLGYNYNGGLIYNFYYPVDFFPEITPDKWNYIYTPGALESWNISNFKNKKSLEYMKSTSMLFDEIITSNSTTNPYNQIDYNLSANKIGLNKVTLNTPATFITNGILTARRKSTRGNISYGIFLTRPMAANVNIKSKLSAENVVYLKDNELSKDININFGSNVMGLNEHATKDSIKEIVSKLYINNKEVCTVSNNYMDYLLKNYTFKIDRNTYSSPKNYPLNIKVVSYFYTEFEIDGIFKNEIEKNITLVVEDYKKEIVRSSDLYILEKLSDEYYLNYLITNSNTKNLSLGLIEKGRNLALKINTEEKLNKEELEIYINNIKKDYEVLLNKDNITVIKIYIDDNIPITISTWNYLRNKTNNYFDINFNDIGKRNKSANEVKIINNKYQYLVKFDTVDNFNYNVNYILENSYQNGEKIKLNDL